MNPNTLWRSLPAEAQNRLRATARSKYPLLARLPDDSWILEQSCLALLKEQSHAAQSFPLYRPIGEPLDQPAA